MSDVLDSVLAAYDVGICPVRAAKDGSKSPLGKWKGYQTCRPDRPTVEAWFNDGHPGWGAITGRVSGNLEMLELEGRAVADGLVLELVEKVRAAGLENLLQRIFEGYTEE